MSNLQLTDVGIPNTCSQCAKMQNKEWYAEHSDAARAGQGVCAACAGATPPKKKSPGRPVNKKKAPSSK